MSNQTAEQAAAQVEEETRQMGELGMKIDKALGDYSLHIIIPTLCFVLASIGEELATTDNLSEDEFFVHIESTMRNAYAYRKEEKLQ